MSGQLSFGGDLAAWPRVAPISFMPQDRPQFVRVRLEPEADVAPSLRVVDETGAETAYVIDPDLHRIGAGGRTATAAPVERSERPAAAPQASPAAGAVWLFDLGGAGVTSGVRLVGAARPDLNVDVQAGSDGATWHEVASGHVAGGTLAFAEEDARYVRVTVLPAADVRPVLLVVPHDLLFEALPHHTYDLLWGNGAAPGPDYDLAARLEREDWNAAFATLGPAVENGAYAQSRPIVERYPWLAAAVLGLAAGTLAVFLVIAARRPREPLA
jgi:hypothetical protein